MPAVGSIQLLSAVRRRERWEPSPSLDPAGNCAVQISTQARLRACEADADHEPFALTTRADWSGEEALDVSGIPASEREAIARGWARAGLLEHASIAAFARFTLQLLALGAPPALVLDARAAIGDETEHARLCFTIASAYAGRPLGPWPPSRPPRWRTARPTRRYAVLSRKSRPTRRATRSSPGASSSGRSPRIPRWRRWRETRSPPRSGARSRHARINPARIDPRMDSRARRFEARSRAKRSWRSSGRAPPRCSTGARYRR